MLNNACKSAVVCALLIFHFCNVLEAKEVPFLSGRVNDDANILSAETITYLEQLLKIHEDSTSNQIAILTIKSLEGEILEEYSLKVAETWQLGQRDKDNGVLLLIAVQDRKMRIEVGYGLEGALTDALSDRIIRDEIVPEFRNGDFDRGLVNGIEAIILAIKGEYANSYASSNEDYTDVLEGIEDEFPWYLRLVFGVVILLILSPFTVFAYVSKGCAGWFLFVFLIPFYLIFPTFILGLIPSMIIFSIYFIGFFIFKFVFLNLPGGKRWYKAHGSKWVTSSGTSGSSWSSGSFSSSSSSFSGGGGSFGGGGSSGSW